LLLGYNSVAAKKLEIHDLYFVNADGEISELVTVFKKKMQKEPDFGSEFRLKQHQNSTSGDLDFLRLENENYNA